MTQIKMTPYEKQFMVAYYLNSKFINVPSTGSILVSTDDFDSLPEDEFINILKKFAVDYRVIYMFPDPNVEIWKEVTFDDGTTARACAIKKEPGFDSFIQELFETFQDIVNERKSKAEEENNKIVYWLTYENDRLLLNNKYQIVKTNHNSINARVLEYLFANQNRKVTREELYEKNILFRKGELSINREVLKNNEDKNFYTFLDDIKIKGDLRDLFFSTDLGVHTLHLKNPIREKDLQGKDIKSLDLDKIAKRLIQN